MHGKFQARSDGKIETRKGGKADANMQPSKSNVNLSKVNALDALMRKSKENASLRRRISTR